MEFARPLDYLTVARSSMNNVSIFYQVFREIPVCFFLICIYSIRQIAADIAKYRKDFPKDVECVIAALIAVIALQSHSQREKPKHKSFIIKNFIIQENTHCWDVDECFRYNNVARLLVADFSDYVIMLRCFIPICTFFWWWRESNAQIIKSSYRRRV